jgi:hypothetical protein
MKKFFVIINILVGTSLMAQDYETDAARMMRPDLSGTARALGVGGAFSTVGADMSCMSSNPAGIAFYRSHEIALTAGGMWGNTSSQYLGQSSSDNFGKGTFSQGGLIFATKRLSDYNNLSFDKGGSKLDRFVFGFGFQKLADFNRTDYYYGTNTKSSYAQALANDLNSDLSSPVDVSHFGIPTVNAFYSNVLNVVDSLGNSAPAIGSNNITQIGHVTTQGSLTDINLTFGFNIANTVFVGFGAGIPYMSYRRYSNFTESNAAGDSAYISTYNYTMSGVGVNGKLGIIVKPVQWMRFGASVQTPTYFHINESDYGNTYSQFKDSSFYSEDATLYNFAYYNPLKATFGASFYLKQWGFISVDYEMNDYTHTHYSFAGSDKSISDQENTLIAAKYKLASTIKAGAEFSYKTLRLRAGFAWSESPFRSGVAVSGYDGARFNYTAGIGYRGKSFFADLAYVRTQYKDFYTPYAYTNGAGAVQEPGVYNNTAVNTIVATIGFKFGAESKTTSRKRVVRDKAFRSY